MRTREDLMRRMRRVRDEFPPPNRTPGAEAELGRAVEEWAPLRRAVNTAMLDYGVEEL